MDGGVAWSFTENSRLHLHVDYILHSFSVIKVKEGVLMAGGMPAWGKGSNVNYCEHSKGVELRCRNARNPFLPV